MLDLVADSFCSFALHVKLIDSNPQDKTGQLLSFYNDIIISRCQTNKGIINNNYFLPKKKSDDEFINRILDILCKSAMTVTEIARALGYKGITRKLRLTIDRLCDEGYIVKSIRGGDIVYRCLRKP